MITKKHTPGPWEIVSIYGDGGFEIKGPPCDGKVVFVASGGCDDTSCIENEMDARLIAAAPELLSALKQCRMAITGSPPLQDSRGIFYQQQFGEAFLNFIDAAIKRATEGEE